MLTHDHPSPQLPTILIQLDRQRRHVWRQFWLLVAAMLVCLAALYHVANVL